MPLDWTVAILGRSSGLKPGTRPPVPGARAGDLRQFVVAPSESLSEDWAGDPRLSLWLSPDGCDDGHSARRVTLLTSTSTRPDRSNCYQFRRSREEVEGVFPDSVIRSSGCLMRLDRWRGVGCRN